MRTTIIAGTTILSLVVGLVLWSWIRDEKERQAIKPYVTYKRLMHVASWCGRYKEQRGAWPNSLTELRTFQPECNPPWSTDAWGKNFILIPYQESLGYGQVISYGRDGKPGGDGLDRDLVVRFPCKPNETWNAKQGEGLPQPRIRP
jgi:hypothetical protein